MNKSPNALKIILYSASGSGSDDYKKTFSALTERNDIIYNEFFNYVRTHNLPLKMILTGCITSLLNFTTDKSKNPFYASVVFEGLTSKNEVADTKNVEFIVQTNAVLSLELNKVVAKPVAIQYSQLPKSNKNVSVELNDYSIFTNPITIKITDSNGNVVGKEPDTAYPADFVIEFWLFVDE